jgi:hypothetical protein
MPAAAPRPTPWGERLIRRWRIAARLCWRGDELAVDICQDNHGVHRCITES